MMNGDNYGLILGGIFAVINIVAFFIMLWDKSSSRKQNAQRISEGMLFFSATVFGSVGVLAGMLVFRHKTRKWYFMFGIPFLILQNIALLFVLYLLLHGEIKMDF